MGNSILEQQKIKYQLISKQKHSILGPISRVEVQFCLKTQPSIMKSRHNIPVEQTNQNIKWLMTKQNHPSSPHHLKKIYCQNSINNSGLCSTNITQQIFYQHFDWDLQYEYYHNKKQGINFTEEKVIEIVDHCVMGLKLHEDINIKFYHICKQSIFRNGSKYMLIGQDDVEVDHPLAGYLGQFTSELLGKNYWLSPQLLQNVEKGEDPPITVKDQIFALGGVILSLCLLDQIPFESEIVEISQNSQKGFMFRQPRIKEQLKKVRQCIGRLNYTEKIKCLLIGMMEYSRQDRIDLDNIIKLVNQSTSGPTSRTQSRQLLPNTQQQKSQSSTPATTPDKQNNRSSTDTHQTRRRKESASPSSLSKNKKIIDVYLDAKHLFQDRTRATIATNVKQYKNSKLSKPKTNLQKIVQKQVLSQIKSTESMFTPIKELTKLQIVDSKQNISGHSRNPSSFMRNMAKTESKYELLGSHMRSYSKTSLALNLISKFHIEGESDVRKPL